MSLSLWAVEFILESLGAAFALKRKNWPLFALLGYLSATDLIFAGVRFFFGNHYLHGWMQRAGKYALLCWLACYICGKLVKAEHAYEVRAAALFFTLLGTVFVVKVYSDGLTISDRLWDAENCANTLICGVMAAAWISRTARLESSWKWIASGLLVTVGSDLMFTALWGVWDGAAYLYPLGAIPAYSMWAFACAKKDSCGTVEGHGDWRPSLGTFSSGNGIETLNPYLDQDAIDRSAKPSSEYQASPAGMFSEQDESFLRSMRIRG